MITVAELIEKLQLEVFNLNKGTATIKTATG